MRNSPSPASADPDSARNGNGGQRVTRSLAVDTQDSIETEIVAGVLRPGEKLDEAVLAARYGVSRTPVREALRSLAGVGLVEFRPRAGVIVAQPTVTEVMDLFELVAELEGVAARLACQRIGEEDEEAIVAAYEACRTAAGSNDPDDYYQVNGRFHRAIHDAAHNEALTVEIAVLDKRLSPYRRFITLRPERTQAALEEHDRIMEALRRRDAEGAADAMRAHVRILRDDAFALAKSLKI